MLRVLPYVVISSAAILSDEISLYLMREMDVFNELNMKEDFEKKSKKDVFIRCLYCVIYLYFSPIFFYIYLFLSYSLSMFSIRCKWFS